MTEPAKDEAELMDRVAKAFCCPSPSGCIDNINCDRLGFQIDAIRAIAAIRAAGWAVVPVEPTGEMFEAGHEEFWEGKGIVDTYRAMLAAAPGVKP
jgi:hypothetical protein